MIQDFRENILCTDEKVWVPLFCGIKQTFHKKFIILTGQTGSVIVWGIFAASAPGWLSVTDNSEFCSWSENVQASACTLELEHICVMQHRPEPKHTSTSTSECQKKQTFYTALIKTQTCIRIRETLLTSEGKWINCMTLNKRFMKETLQCGWIRTILQRKTDQCCSTVMWMTQSQSSVDCSVKGNTTSSWVYSAITFFS